MFLVDDSVDNVMIPNKENDKGSIAIAMGIVSIVLLMTAISAGIFCYCFKQNCSGKINTLPPIFFCYGGWMVKNNSHGLIYIP